MKLTPIRTTGIIAVAGAMALTGTQGAFASSTTAPSTATTTVNPDNLQNYSLDFQNPKTANETTPSLQAMTARGTVFHGSRTQRVGKSGYVRVAFSTGVVLNRASLPTRVQFDGESQLCFSLPGRPSSVSLTDKYTVSGIAISGTIGSGTSISGSASKKTITTKHSKKKPSKKTCINNVARGISFKGAIVHVKEQVVGEVVYKNTKYKLQVGDE